MIKDLLNRLKRVFAPTPSVPSCADKLTPEEWAEVVRYVAQQLNEKAMVEKPTAKSSKASTASPRKASQKRSNVGQLVTELTDHLRAHYAFRYNVLTEQAEMARIDVPSVYYPVGKRELNTLSLEAQEAGLACWDRDVCRYVESERVEKYHPFTDYFDHLPKWDGVDRVTPLAKRVSDNPVWVNGFHIWLRAVSAQYMGLADMGNSLMPILISQEQGWGKSTFCRNLLPEELRRYYTESFDLSNPSTAEDKLSAFGLVNLDEMDRLSDKRMATLKNTLQVSVINTRRAYHRNVQSLRRIASFIGTSNRRDLLTDRSGSRRFLCVELEHPIDALAPIDYPQLYAQLKEEVKSGERTWLTKEEEAAIQDQNRPFYRVSLEEDVFYRCFRFAERGEEGAVVLTAAEIFKEMQKANPTALRGLTAYAFSRLLPSMGKRIRTKYCNGYCVVRVNRQS
jgi:predicted P-loop ATPase